MTMLHSSGKRRDELVTSNAANATTTYHTSAMTSVRTSPDRPKDALVPQLPSQATMMNESAATHTTLPGAGGTQDGVGKRSPERRETRRQMSPAAAADDQARANGRDRELTTASHAGDDEDDYERKATASNCDAGDDVRPDLGDTTNGGVASDDRKHRAAAARRRHSTTSLNGGTNSQTAGTWHDASRTTQPADVIAATPLQVRGGVTVTSCSQPEATSVPRGRTPDRHTHSDQSHQPNRHSSLAGPQQTSVVNVVGKPVTTATRTP